MAMNLIPESFVARAPLGPELRNPVKLKSIDDTAEKLMADKILAPNTVAEQRVQNGNAIRLVHSFGCGVDQVSGLLRRADPLSPATNKAEKQAANDALDTLAKAAFIVMQYSGEVTLQTSLNTPGTVDAVLPPALHGLGERIMSNIITNAEILRVLTELDESNEMANMMGPGGDRFMMPKVDDALTILSQLKVPKTEKDEQIMALAFVGTVGVDLEARLHPQAGGAFDGLEKLFSGEARSLEQFQTFTGNIMTEDAYRLQDEALPLWYSRPDIVGVEGFDGKDGIERWQRLVSVAAGINNWVAFKRKADYKIEYLLNAPELKAINQEKLTKLWGAEPEFRKAAQRIFKDLFTRDTSFPDQAVFAIRLKTKDEDSRMPERMNSFSGYMKEVVADMVAGGMNEDLAKMYVATAAHIFVDVTTVDFADKDRSYNGRAMDPIRSLANSEKKALDKAGVKPGSSPEDDQMFGGKLWDLLNRLADLNPEIPETGMTFIDWVKDAQAKGEMIYFPKSNGLSWVEMDPVMVNINGQVEFKTIAQLLMQVDDADIDYTKTVDAKNERGDMKHVKGVLFAGGGDDGLCGVYQRDYWPAIVVLGNVFKGSTDLDIRDWGKVKAFLKEIGNGWRDLLKATVPGTKHPIMDSILNNPRYLAMAVVNAWPIGPLGLHHEIVLPMQPGNNYDKTVARDIVANMVGVTPEMRMKIIKELHANSFTQMNVWNPLTDGKRARRKVNDETARNEDRARKKGMVL